MSFGILGEFFAWNRIVFPKSRARKGKRNLAIAILSETFCFISRETKEISLYTERLFDYIEDSSGKTEK